VIPNSPPLPAQPKLSTMGRQSDNSSLVADANKSRTGFFDSMKVAAELEADKHIRELTVPSLQLKKQF